MSKFVAGANVTCRKDLRVRRLQPGVHLDSALVAFDTDRFQSDPLHIRSPSDTDKNLIDRHIVLLTVRIHGEPLSVAGLFYCQIFPTAEHRHAIAHHLLFDEVRCVTVFVRQDAVQGFNQVDLAPKAGKRLGQLAPDRPGADHPDAWRQFRQ